MCIYYILYQFFIILSVVIIENYCQADIEKDKGEEECKELFDEDAYLSGKLNIFGRSQPVNITRKEKGNVLSVNMKFMR